MVASSPGSDQYVMIIGAMKSGTSALFDVLVQHPAVCPSLIKEPEFFSQHQGHGMAVAHYADLWRFDPAHHQVALEASTGYTKYPREQGVAERIAAAGLYPRFIYLLRDPVRRIESQVTYATWGRRGAVADYRDPDALSISRYAQQLDQFTSLFPKERFLLLRQSDLQRDPRAVAAEVFSFLELPPFEIAAAEEAKNPARPRSGWERRIMRSGAVARLATHAPASLKSLMRRLSGARAAGRPAMDAETEAFLRAELAPEMRRLASEWGMDVSPWGFVPDDRVEA